MIRSFVRLGDFVSDRAKRGETVLKIRVQSRSSTARDEHLAIYREKSSFYIVFEHLTRAMKRYDKDTLSAYWRGVAVSHSLRTDSG